MIPESENNEKNNYNKSFLPDIETSKFQANSHRVPKDETEILEKQLKKID
jgi:hypothetical protein